MGYIFKENVMRKAIILLFTVFLLAGCEKNYQSLIIGEWKGFRVVNGEMTFIMPVEWTDVFDTYSFSYIFNPDNTGWSTYIIDNEQWPSSKFVYELDRETITIQYYINETELDPPNIFDYSIEGDILTIGNGTYLRQ